MVGGKFEKTICQKKRSEKISLKNNFLSEKKIVGKEILLGEKFFEK